MASIGSAAFTLTSQFDSAQVQASVDRLNASVAASVKDVSIGSQLDQAKLQSVLADASAKIAKTQANVRIGADVQATQIDAAIAKANAEIAALSKTGGESAGTEFNSGFAGIMSPEFLVPAVTAATALLPGVFAVAGAAGAVALGAAFAVAGSKQLQTEGKSLVSGLETTVEDAASVLDKPLEDAFTGLEKELPTLKSLLGSTFSTAAPLISPLEKMLVSIVNGTLPGFNTLLKDSAGPLSVFFVNTGKIVGTGLDKFLAALGPGASASLTDIDGLLTVLLKLATETATVSSEIAGIPSVLNKLGSSLNATHTPLATLGKDLHIPDSGNNLFQELPKWVDWLGQHLPGGNKTLLQLAESTDSVTASAGKTGPALQSVVTPAGQLAAAMNTAAADTTKLDSAWNTLVGNFNGEQASIVAAKQAVDNYATAVKQSGASSLAAQSAFYSAVSSIQSMTDAMVKAHAPASQVYADIESQITTLKAKGPLNAAEKQDLADLQTAANGVAMSTSGLTSAQLSLAAADENQLLPSLTALHTSGTTLNTDMTQLAASILNTGTQSSATASARSALIQDLISAGVQAGTAKTDVGDFQSAIDGLKGKTVAIGADTSSGTTAIESFQQAVNSLQGKTITIGAQVIGSTIAAQTILNGMDTGGIVHAAAGYTVRGRGASGRDSVLAMLAPGELVIPTSHAPKFRDMARKSSIPGYAGGMVSEPFFSGQAYASDYTFSDHGAAVPAVVDNAAGQGLPPMTRQQGQQVTTLLTDIRKLLAQQPYTQAEAIRQSSAAGVRRGYFQTGG